MEVDPKTPQAMVLDPEERLDLLLEQHGPNEIRRRQGASRLRELGRQFTHPLALLLWAAAALAIVAVIVLNAVFAFFQELQAEKATEALRRYLPPRARVRREGRAVEVEATTLVPGDLLLLSEGDRPSADAPDRGLGRGGHVAPDGRVAARGARHAPDRPLRPSSRTI